MTESNIEKLICDKNFAYLEPYFYKNKYALRCELGIGEGDEYMRAAKKRAMEIYDILFPCGADAIIFDYWIYDHSTDGEPDMCRYKDLGFDIEEAINNNIKFESERLRFLLEYQAKYRHLAVRDLETYDAIDDEDYGRTRRNRIVCYSDGKGFDHSALIDLQINWDGYDIGFVSFKNECILSVYDDRGCDVVFAIHDKMKEFYHKLEPYFLDYDAEEMEKRYNL